jgi:hypothetical protein
LLHSTTLAIGRAEVCFRKSGAIVGSSRTY